MKKRRRLRVGRLIVLLLIVAGLIGLIVYGVYRILITPKDQSENYDTASLCQIQREDMKESDLDLYSKYYLLMRLNDYTILYGKGIDEMFYPASLTKVLTLDTVVSYVDDLSLTSSFSASDYWDLVAANASLAGLQVDKEYTIFELLYSLVLPSGADGARALENFFSAKGLDLVEEMNALAAKSGALNSHFSNTTGLHDKTLYTTLSDYAKIVVDTLKKEEAKKILKTLYYETEDLSFTSTLASLEEIDNITVYGGKTGFTGEAGENIMVLFDKGGRSYLLILAGAQGNPYQGELYHFDDVKSIIENME